MPWSDSMLITIPWWACAWPWSEWPWPLAATVSSEPGPICQTCFMVVAISETDFGCKTAWGRNWYRFPKSLAACSIPWKLKCPSTESVSNEEGMMGRQRLMLAVKQPKNKMTKLAMKRMLLGLRKLIAGYLIFFLRKDGRSQRQKPLNIVFVSMWEKKKERCRRAKEMKGWGGNLKVKIWVAESTYPQWWASVWRLPTWVGEF